MGSTGHDLATTVNYYADPGDGSLPTPVYVGSTKVTNERPTVSVPVTVTDVTGNEDSFTLDTHGFAYVRDESCEKGFHDEEVVKGVYYAECEALVSTFTGAKRVFAFDHKVRRGPAYWHRLGENNAASRGPLRNAHVDQSYDGAVIRLREQIGDGEVGGRWGIINVWRPIKTVFKDPLAVADARSVEDTDLVAASIIYVRSGRRMESWTVKPNAKHRWYFKYAQTPEEVLLIKCFDSGETVARRVPHCAVEDSEQRDSECRESVEVRCLVFY